MYNLNKIRFENKYIHTVLPSQIRKPRNDLLAAGEKFKDVVREDMKVLKNAGITSKEAADLIERAINASQRKNNRGRVNDHLFITPMLSNTIVFSHGKEIYKTYAYYCFSRMPCGYKLGPGKEAGHSTDSMFSEEQLASLQNSRENSTKIPTFMSEIIAKYNFLGGNVKYGLKPEWIIDLAKLIEKEGIKDYPSRAFEIAKGILGTPKRLLSNAFSNLLEKVRNNVDDV
ncbi:MAG: hypothetical protein NT051_01475 [Candidatus Micrarchaeota archaeon]|nr:hypothetical protein [Candidatus Micrarchaeota archaeon]